MRQTDLFGASSSATPMPKGTSRETRYAKWVEELEGTGDYRVIRRLIPRPVLPRTMAADERIGILVDVETTGLDHAKNEIIEFGMVAFAYDASGCIQRVVDVFAELRQPSIPIPDEIVQLTGIDDAMVAGKSIEACAVSKFIADASLVIAHNARFDRPFCERFAESFSLKPWACSLSEIEWSSFGFEGSKLGYLLNHLGWFHSGHRASDDCHALLEILDAPLPGQPDTGFMKLLEASQQERHRIWAERSPFEFKDILKGRGYRWNDGSDGRPKSWWIEVPDSKSYEEIAFLKSEIYQRDLSLMVQRLTAYDRFRP